MNHNRHSILWRVILYFSLASIAMSVLGSGAILAWNYHKQLQSYEQKLSQIRSGYAESLGSSLWFYDEVQLHSQIKGILNLSGVRYVRVSDNLNMNIENGERPHSGDINRLPLAFNGKDIGVLEIAFDHELLLQQAMDTAASSMTAQLLSLLFLTLLLGYIVYNLLNRRISLLAREVQQRLHSHTFAPLSVTETGQQDEIDTLVRAFNALSAQMNDELQQKTQAQQQLKVINQELEHRVADRTRNLQQTVDELNQTLHQLHTAQSKLIEAEKLSSLGSMVAGIAHEINTPLGLCITIHSFIDDHFQELKQRFDAGEMRKQDFTDFLAMLDESLTILHKNQQRAAQLIKSFKQVSEDQTGEHIRHFQLREYLDEILETLSPRFKQTRHRVEIDCAADLWLETYPGAISQIITNLILNSLLHGFEHKEEGTISIQAALERGKLVLHYRDNGCGLSAEARQKIFDPFYTTKRGQGGTGLGMHLVYSIVHQRLQGRIDIIDSAQGAAFRLELPQQLHQPFI